MSNEDREKRLKALEDFAFNIDKIVKQPEPVNDEEVILNASRETTSQSGHATARQAKVTQSGREQLDPPPSGRHSSTRISWPWEDWSLGDWGYIIYFGSCFPFYNFLAIAIMSDFEAVGFGIDPNTSLLKLIPSLFFSLILGIITAAAARAVNEDSPVSPWAGIWLLSIYILIPVASSIIFWQSSFSIDFYGQVLLVILTIGSIFILIVLIFANMIEIKNWYEYPIAFFACYGFFSFSMLIPLVTLSFIPGFHLAIGSFPALLMVCFLVIPFFVVMSIMFSLCWPLAIVVYIIWRLFNPDPFPTSIGDVIFFDVFLVSAGIGIIIFFVMFVIIALIHR